MIIDQIHQSGKVALPTREYLKYLSEEFSVDFATLYLATNILGDNANKHMQSLFNKEFTKVRLSIKKRGYQSIPESSSYIFLFAPGWFYKSKPENGADFAKPRGVLTQIGLENHLIEIEENAVFIAKEIIYYSCFNKKIILVSASKAGPEVALALSELLDSHQTQNVAAWINIGASYKGVR